MIHGIIKLVAVAGSLLGQLWAYPFSLITLGILAIYQLVSIYEKPSVGMILLTIFGIIILVMIWREWGNVKAMHAKAREEETATASD